MTLKTGTLSGGFSNRPEIITTVYDFTADTGATGVYVMTPAAGEDLIVKLLGIRVDTALSSGGSMTLSVGNSGSAAAYVTTEAVASFGLNLFLAPEDVSTGIRGFVKLASGSTLDMSIIDATLLTGKLTFFWEVMKF